MADTFSEAKEEERYRSHNNRRFEIDDIVELRKPLRGILGVIKYIGPKLNENGERISEKVHYIIQLAEYVGNGNGIWSGYKYITPLRPNKTMHLCKEENIRCPRTPDSVLKALYNLLRSHKKLEKEIKNQSRCIDELRDINYAWSKHIESRIYYPPPMAIPSSNLDIKKSYLHPPRPQSNLNINNSSVTSHQSIQNMQFQPHTIHNSRNSVHSQSPRAIVGARHHHNISHNNNMNSNNTSISTANLQNQNQSPQHNINNVVNIINNNHHHNHSHSPIVGNGNNINNNNNNRHPQHLEYNQHHPSTSSLIPHSGNMNNNMNNTIDQPHQLQANDNINNMHYSNGKDIDIARDKSEKWVQLNNNQRITPPPPNSYQIDNKKQVIPKHRRNQSEDYYEPQQQPLNNKKPINNNENIILNRSSSNIIHPHEEQQIRRHPSSTETMHQQQQQQQQHHQQHQSSTFNDNILHNMRQNESILTQNNDSILLSNTHNTTTQNVNNSIDNGIGIGIVDDKYDDNHEITPAPFIDGNDIDYDDIDDDEREIDDKSSQQLEQLEQPEQQDNRIINEDKSENSFNVNVNTENVASLKRFYSKKSGRIQIPKSINIGEMVKKSMEDLADIDTSNDVDLNIDSDDDDDDDGNNELDKDDNTSDDNDNESVHDILTNVDIKEMQQKLRIDSQTTGKQITKLNKLNKKKSIEKTKKLQVVSSNRAIFENMIKSNNINHNTKPIQKIDERNEYNNIESENRSDHDNGAGHEDWEL